MSYLLLIILLLLILLIWGLSWCLGLSEMVKKWWYGVRCDKVIPDVEHLLLPGNKWPSKKAFLGPRISFLYSMPVDDLLLPTVTPML